ncbi:MAG: hypothetical protein AAF518_09640 [Spirochaetota bacterium]
MRGLRNYLTILLISWFCGSCLAEKPDNILSFMLPLLSSSDSTEIGVNVSETSLAVSEGGNAATYTISLNRAPTADVSITFSTDDRLNAIPSIQFTTTDWNVAQSISVSPLDDALANGNLDTSITHTVTSNDPDYNGFAANAVAVSIADNDSIGITMNVSDASATEGSDTASYTVVLNTQPSSDVTVNITNDSQVTLSSNSLTFTTSNWNTAQTITVTAVDDTLTEGTHTPSITHAVSSSDSDYNSISVSNPSISITDNDVPGVTITATDDSANESGDTASYTVVLNTAPTANVTVTITDDSQATLSSNSLTFTTSDWNTAQTVTVTAVDDAVTEGPHTPSITHSVSSSDGNYNGVSVTDPSITILDNDNGDVTITQSGSDTSVMEGFGDDTISYVLTSMPTNDVTFSISFDTSQVQVNGSSTSPVQLTFTSANWNVAQSVTVTAVADAVIESATHTSTLSYSTSSTDLFYHVITLTGTDVNIIEDHGTHLVGSFETGSVNITNSNTTINLTTSVNALTSFVSCNFQYYSSANHHAATCQLSSDGSQVEIKTGGGTSARVNYYVVEFDSGTIVQRGASSFASGDTSQTVTLDSTIDTSRTMVIAYTRTTDSSHSVDERRFIKAVVTNSTTLTLSRSESGSTAEVEYQVIMMSSSSVQSGEVTLANGSTSVTDTISTVDLNTSFLVFNYTGAGSINGIEHNLYTRGSLASTTSVEFTRTGTNGDIPISYFVVTLTSGIQSIQRGSTAIASTAVNTNQAISSVDLTRSLVILSNDTEVDGSDASAQDSSTYWVDTSSTGTQLTFSRNNHENRTATINWEVVEFSP